MQTIEISNELVRDNILTQELILLDGIGRSGKAMMGQIMSSFKRVEMLRLDFLDFDYIHHLYRLKKITFDAAKAMLNIAADMMLYNLMIGRSVNYRFSDLSSIYKSHNPDRYIMRSTLAEGKEVIDRIKKEKPILQEEVHDGLKMAQFFFDVFEDRLKIVYMYRDPVYIIDSWIRRNFGERIGVDPIEFHLTYKWKGKVVPVLAFGWEDDYLSISPIDRIVGMVDYNFRTNLEGYKKLPLDLKERVLIIEFDKFIMDPMPIVKKAAEFLNTEVTSGTNDILIRERCPRSPALEDRRQKKRDILNKINSAKYKEVFLDLCEKFENNYWEIE